MASPSPTADPRDALYYSNDAALKFQQTKTEGADTAARENAAANYRYGTQQQRAGFKLRIPNLRNQANAQGLTESGINAQRQQQAATDYTSKQNRIGEIRQRAITQANTNDAEAGKEYGVRSSQNLADATERARIKLIENPEPQPTTLASGGPPGSRVESGPGSTQQPLKFGFKEAEAREAAARKARKR